MIILIFVIVVTVLVLELYPPIGKTPDRKERKGYAGKCAGYYKRKFHNESEYKMMTGRSGKVSKRARPSGKLPVVKNQNIPKGKKGKLNVTWYGHSTILVQLGEKNILIDPILTKRSSPVSFAGPKRFSELAISPERLPEIDVVFISHDHYDHLDYQTVKKIDNRVRQYIVPLGVDSCLRGWGIDRSKIHALGWWESIEVEGVSYTLIPSKHFTGRNPLKYNVTLWGGIYFEDGSHSVYYSGDTGYNDVFSKVYERFGAVDLMMADSGQFDKAWAQTHMHPKQSVQAAVDAHAKWFIPVHWGAFVLANHAWDATGRIAVETAEKLGVNIATPKIGERVDYDNISSFHEHWWEGIDGKQVYTNER